MKQYVDNTNQPPSIISICTGIRGLERGLIRALGCEPKVAAYVENEAFICENLLAAMEASVVAPAPIWTDLRTFDFSPFRGKVHGIVGGYPCQGFSLAGKRQGAADPRYIWPFIKEGIRTAGFIWCFFENVDDHLTMGFDTVYKDLHELGYLVETGIYSAEEAGAPHERQRLYIFAIRQEMAYTNGYDPGRIIDNVLRTKRESLGEEDKRQRDRYEPSTRGEAMANAGSIGVHQGGSIQQSKQPEQDGLQGRDEELENTGRPGGDGWSEGDTRGSERQGNAEGSGSEVGDTQSIGREGYPFVGRNLIEKDGEVQWCWPVRADTAFAGWPAGQGDYQFPYEEPRVIKPLLVDNVDGGKYKRDTVFLNDYGQKKERAIEELLELWQFINQEAIQWDIGRLSMLLKEKILYNGLLSSLSPQKLIISIKQPYSGSQDGGGHLHRLRYKGKLASASCGPQPLEQLCRQFEDALWVMSYQIALARGEAETSPKLYERMFGMWDVYKNTRWDVSNALSKVQEIWQPAFDESTHAGLWVDACREYVMENNRFVHIGDLHRAIGNSVVEQTAEIAFIDLIHKHIKTANYGRTN